MGIIGRHKAPCLCCGFDSVHVKQNEGKFPFLHCPECGFVATAKSGQQAAGMIAGMRKEGDAKPVNEPKAAAAVPSPSPKPAPAPEPVPAPAAKRPKLGMWEQLAQGGRAA